jgi:hypothetical protein
MGRSVRTASILCALCGAALARPADLPARIGRALDWPQELAVRDSLRSVHPRLRSRWLADRGLSTGNFMPVRLPDSGSGLRLVGKWGRGPANEVTGRESLVVLTLGSEVALLDCSDRSTPSVLSEVQLDFPAYQSVIRGSLLVTGGWGRIELWRVTDAEQPEFLGGLAANVLDFCVRDTLLCFVSGDSFRVWSIADPARPHQLGARPDSGRATAVTGNTVALVLRNGIGFVDVSDPRHPQRVGLYGGSVLSAAARGSICVATFDLGGVPPQLSVEVVDVSDPAAPTRLGVLNGVGGYDVDLLDTFALVSGWSQGFGFEYAALSISDSTHPRLLGTCATPGSNYGVWFDSARRAVYIADWREGLAVIDATSLVIDTTVLVADEARDVSVDAGRAYISDYTAGLRVLDVTDPARPVETGGLDSANVGCRSAVARDSFAYAGWTPMPYLRSIDVTDIHHPQMAGGCQGLNEAEDMVLRDSLLYIAARLRFWILNVARPRQPVLVGSCVLPGDVWDLDVEDTLAYVTSSSLIVVNISRPDSPFITATWTAMVGVDAVDSIMYTVGSGYVWSVSMARPSQPVVLDTLRIPSWVSDIVVEGSRAYAGGVVLHVLDVSDPRDLREVGQWTPPHEFRRLLAAGPHVYAVCYDAGVCVLETTAVGVRESEAAGRLKRLRLWPIPARDRVSLDIGGPDGPVGWRVHDVAGRVVLQGHSATEGGAFSIAVAGVPAGVYLVTVGPAADAEYRALLVRSQ